MMAVRVAGTGGQGVQVAGMALAAAALASGWNVACTQSYGPESRGGASRTDVVLDRREIDYPRAERVDVLVALSREAWERFAVDLRPGGILIGDEGAVGEPPAGATVYALPLLAAARAAGSAVAANVAALGALWALTEIVPLDALAAAIARAMPHAWPANQRALEAGRGLGARAREAQTAAAAGVDA